MQIKLPEQAPCLHGRNDDEQRLAISLVGMILWFKFVK